MDLNVVKQVGSHKNIIAAPYAEQSFESLGIKRDLWIENNNGAIAWTHRKSGSADIFSYLIKNLTPFQRQSIFLFLVKNWNRATR